MIDNSSDFSAWLLGEMERRGMSQTDLARKSGVSESVMSRVVSGKRAVGWLTCRRIARVLNVSPLVVFLKAGLLDENDLPLPDMMTPEEQTLVLMFRQIPIEDQRRLLKIARCFVSGNGSE